MNIWALLTVLSDILLGGMAYKMTLAHAKAISDQGTRISKLEAAEKARQGH